MPPNQQGRSQLLGYVYASPLVRRREDGKRERMDQLGTHEELEMIRKKLSECGRQIRFRAEVAKASNLRQLLNSGCRMLHYTGHGNNEFLAFESNQDVLCGVMEPLLVERLKKLFQAGGVRTELVFISSCSSELSGNAFVEAGVPHVVAVKREESVTDQAAQQFANQFYDALMSADGRYTVKQAFDIALSTVNAADNNNNNNDGASPQGDHFLLLPHDGDHEKRIFDTLPQGIFIDDSPVPPPRPRCAKPVRFYKGLVELQKVVEILVDQVAACVTIIGEHGSGKTERAIQACDYVRMRHHFDSVLWADLKKAIADAAAYSPNMWTILEDPCRLIGVAAGMPQPGPDNEEELIRFLFKNPTTEGGRDCRKVLLVLDNADSLFEGGGDARDRLVELLSNLCSRGEHLKLLVTSEKSLLRDTNERFRNGSERVAKVKRLKARDAAQLLVDKVPTRFTKSELGLPPDCNRDDILRSLQGHPVLEAADGHPGTLLRLAPLLEDHSLNDACVLERAKQHRLEYQNEGRRRLRTNSRASSTTSLASSTGGGNDNGSLSFMGEAPTTPTRPHLLRPAFSHETQFLQQQQQQQQQQHHHNGHINGGMPFFQGGSSSSAWVGGSEMHHPLLHGAGMAGMASIHGSGIGGSAHASHASHHHHHHQRRHSSHPHQSSSHILRPQPSHLQRRMTMQNQRLAQEELEEPDPPMMTQEEKRAWDTARNAALMDRGCRLVWVKASADAFAHGWRYDGGGSSDGDGNSGGGGGGGGSSGGGGGGWAMGLGSRTTGMARYDFVPWEFLREGLMQHLCGKLTIPSSHNEVMDDGPYGWIDDRTGDAGAGGGGYGAVNTPQVRWVNDEELAFVQRVLKAKQEKVRLKQERQRQQMANRGFDGSELRPVGSSGGGGGGGGAVAEAPTGGVAEKEDGGGGGDLVSLEAFVEFSQWWAPLMATLSILRNDWASTDPIRVHGFVGRLAAERKLRQQERGTFLLRFSESKQGALVVSFTEHVTRAPGVLSSSPPTPFSASPSSSSFSSAGRRPSSMTCVKHCLVEVRQGGRCYIEVEQGSKVPYRSLHDLVRACSSMQTLYPDVPKEEAFYEVGGSVGESESDTGVSTHPPNMARLSVGGGPVTGGVVTLEEWGSRPIEMVLVDDVLDADMTLAAPV